MKNSKALLFLLVILAGSPSMATTEQKPLRILVVAPHFPPNSGSMIINQITGLIRCGHEVYIAAHVHNALPTNKIHVDVARYNLMNRTYFYNKSIFEVPNLERFDIIYCQLGEVGKEWIACKKNKSIKAKVVTCFRGDDVSSTPRQHAHIYDELFAKGDLFLPVCDHFKRELMELGCDQKKIKTHHSAIDCDKFFYRARTLKKGDLIQIISVGRLVKKKGLDYAIKAVAQLHKKYPNIRYRIVGYGWMEPELRRLINQLGMQKVITITGQATEEEVVQYLNDSHIFLLPSITRVDGGREGIPNSLKEAMAMGLPVVSTRHAGIPELVDNGLSGWLVKERDVASLVEKIDWLIVHPDKWALMGAAGRKKVKKEYEKNTVNNRLIEIFYALLKR